MRGREERACGSGLLLDVHGDGGEHPHGQQGSGRQHHGRAVSGHHGCGSAGRAERTADCCAPASAPGGSFHLLACADDTGLVAEEDETNNCLASPGTILITKADLVESSVGNPPASLAPGAAFTATDTAQNQGSSPAGASTTRYYLSVDTARDGADPLLAGSRTVPGLAVGGSSSGSAPVTLPAGTPAGNYYLLACADDLDAVPEASDANNCRASSGRLTVTRPDLVEAAVSNPPPTVIAGAFFSVTDTVTNLGNGSAGGSTTRYYLSLDALKDAADPLLSGARGVGTLAAGGSSTGTVNVTVPAATPLGTYYLIACADDTGFVAESDETNNCRPSSATVRVSLP